MNTAIAATLGVIMAIVVACLGINAYLLLTKQISNPHEVLGLARRGHRLGRLYVVLVVLAGAAFALQLVLIALRGT